MSHTATRTLRVVGGILVHEDGKRFLVTQRRDGDTHGGKWEFPGGSVEPGEVDDEALIRKLEEELGIEVEVGRLVKRVREPLSDELLLDFRAYRCTLAFGEPEAIEVQDFQWVTADEARGLDMPPADLPVLELLVAEGLA